MGRSCPYAALRGLAAAFLAGTFFTAGAGLAAGSRPTLRRPDGVHDVVLDAPGAPSRAVSMIVGANRRNVMGMCDAPDE